MGESKLSLRPVRRLLIANRGEIAVRIARTARAMGISPVTIHSDPDAEARHVQACDAALAIGGATAAESYLRGERLIEAALRLGADAVHPGYGFLSENAEFAGMVLSAGLNWVGPRPETIRVMGDKVRAKRMMEAAGVPVLRDVIIDSETDVRAAAAELPLPIIAKAIAGGGGKGMRLIDCRDQLEELVRACQREAAAAFGDDRVFLERFLPGPRHIEVQILGDRHGNVVHLFERECSIQRRHQKVIEEAPSPAIDDALRNQLCQAAVAAGQALGYEGAGTVEFVVGADRSIAFLEVNTRLQVEHPVTEAITGLDLVRAQLEIAQNMPLALTQDRIRRHGHAIEARLYAEDPAKGYLPAAGMLHAFEPGLADTVRWDSGFGEGDVVSAHYDPLIAKVIAHGENRLEAARKLETALRDAHLHGPPNNRDLLCAILSHPAFLAGMTTTSFLAEHFPDDAARGLPAPDHVRRDAAIAACMVGEWRHSRGSTLPSGWRNNPSSDQQVVFAGEPEYRIGYLHQRDGSWRFRLPGEVTVRVRRHDIDDRRIDLAVDGRRLRARYSSAAVGEDLHWEITLPDGHAALIERPRFPQPEVPNVPGATRAPMHGVLRQVAITVGDVVAKGQLLCILEAMKMEHQLRAPHAGIVTSVPVRQGEQVEADQMLVIIEERESAG